MNAIILSALLGVVMMFTSILTENKSTIRYVAMIGLLMLFIGNLLSHYGIYTMKVDTHNMLSVDNFGIFFNTIAIAATFLYVVLSGRDMERLGKHLAEYFALIFFVLCGVAILASYNSLLMLFLGCLLYTSDAADE